VHRLPHSALHVNPGFAVVAVLCVAAANTVSAVLWRHLLADRGVSLPLGESVRSVSLSQLGKYIPGGFWQPLGWLGLARQAGVGTGVASVSIAATMILLVAGAFIVGPILLAASRAAGAFVWLIFAVPVVLAALHPRVLGPALRFAARIVKRPGLDVGGLSFGSLLAGLAYAIPLWLLHGTGLAFTAAALHLAGAGDWPLLTGAFAIAWAIGFLAIPVPGGLGVREAVLLLILRATFTTAEAVLLAVAFRLIFILAEGAMTAVALALPRGRAASPSVGGRPVGVER
jgi:uncharacterized membrane protein YbhN (UPF0104 family)